MASISHRKTAEGKFSHASSSSQMWSTLVNDPGFKLIKLIKFHVQGTGEEPVEEHKHIFLGAMRRSFDLRCPAVSAASRNI
jgi:hypothetical protein